MKLIIVILSSLIFGNLQASSLSINLEFTGNASGLNNVSPSINRSGAIDFDRQARRGAKLSVTYRLCKEVFSLNMNNQITPFRLLVGFGIQSFRQEYLVNQNSGLGISELKNSVITGNVYGGIWLPINDQFDLDIFAGLGYGRYQLEEQQFEDDDNAIVYEVGFKVTHLINKYKRNLELTFGATASITDLGIKSFYGAHIDGSQQELIIIFGIGYRF